LRLPARGTGRMVEDLAGDDLKSNFVGPERMVCSDPEMDMNRAVRSAADSGMWWLIATLKRLSPGFFAVETPKRSVDRELQEIYSTWR